MYIEFVGLNNVIGKKFSKVLTTYEFLSLNPSLFVMNDLPHRGGEFH